MLVPARNVLKVLSILYINTANLAAVDQHSNGSPENASRQLNRERIVLFVKCTDGPCLLPHGNCQHLHQGDGATQLATRGGAESRQGIWVGCPYGLNMPSYGHLQDCMEKAPDIRPWAYLGLQPASCRSFRAVVIH